MFTLRGEHQVAILRVGDPVPIHEGDNQEVGDGESSNQRAINADVHDEGGVAKEAAFFDGLFLHAIELGGFAGEAEGLGWGREGGREKG